MNNSEINKKVVMFIAAMGSVLTPFMGSSIVIALPAIGKEFAMNTVLLNWVATSFLLASAIFVVPFGRLADIYGRKRIFLLGITIFTFANILCGISISASMLLVSRVIQGIGGAMMFGTSVAILTSVYPPGERGRVLGINVGVVYFGLSAGPFFGGFLTQHLGWRSIFFITVPFGLTVIILILLKLKYEWAEAAGESFDYTGSIIYGIGLFGIMCGLSLIRTSWIGPFLMVAGTAAVIFFGIFEIRVKNPILGMALFKNNRVLTFSSIAALINYSATYAVSYLLSLYLQYIKGYGPQEAGLILVVQPVIQALFSPVTGRLSDRMEPRKVSSIGMALSTAGLLIFIFLSGDSSVLHIIAGLVLIGFGFALFSSPNTNAVMSSVEKRFYGVTSGLLGTARLVGQTFSMGIAALIFAVYMGTAQMTQEYHPHFVESMRMDFIVLTLLCFAGIFASLARGRMHE